MVKHVYIASDADIFVTRPIYDACREKGDARMNEVPSMKQLRRNLQRAGSRRRRRHPALKNVCNALGLRGQS